MMHELFLASPVKDDFLQQALAVIGGFCEMREKHQITRILHYEPNPATKGLSTIKELQRERTLGVPSWIELHQILSKQPCTVQVRTQIYDSETEAAKNGQRVIVPAKRERHLRWTELPDPPSQRLPPYITQRRILEIIDPRIETLMATNKFTRTSHIYEYSYHWWHKKTGVEFMLVRTFVPDEPLDPQQVVALDTVEPLAPFWMLYVCTLSESKPEPMQRVQAFLEQIRNEFVGVFEFKVFDRRALDTRVTGVKP
ncbi:hypothetical protein QBC35DRAFT_230217 [Podospora australis]|uniref:Mediator of RNA polymerase II transcription subunit 18 n=1 Tax=Podospora australis TaxID=1536484 RepID=A0AAN6WTA5_9PEZI|nr:hypothetical protein QBC35DRAFT_230217 [Podospora australis]